MRRITALLASLALVLTVFPATAAAAPGPSPTGAWIVTLRPDVDPAAAAGALAREHGGRLGYVYEHALNGFSFRGSQAAATALQSNPNVVAVEADAEVWLETTQSSATWGLDRIDQRSLPLSGTYTYEQTGSGVTAYVIDSGIRFSHAQFGGRAVLGADFVGDGQNGNDCNGHGTHVAGTIGGSTYGVAKNVTLVSVRVFGCTGGSTWETIIAGINWAAGDHTAGAPAVANMSLGGGASSSVDSATNGLITDGVATAVAAGNGNVTGLQANACNYSPARVPAAMTISATDSSDRKVSWANYGDCVDWFAPGVSITSSWSTSNTATNTISGTSMATPHTAGAAALYLEANPGASPATVRDALYDATTKGIVTSSSTANNHLLYSLVAGGSQPPTNTAPVASDVSATGDENTTISWTPAVSDTDGDALTCSIASQSSSGGTATVAPNCGSGTYAPATDFTGTATFTYAVSDGSASDSATVTITVNGGAEPPPGAFTLAVNAYKVKGVKRADLTWAGAAGTNVDVYRNGAHVTTAANDGAFSETLGKGGGSYTYQLCEAGTSTCSNSVTVSY